MKYWNEPVTLFILFYFFILDRLGSRLIEYEHLIFRISTNILFFLLLLLYSLKKDIQPDLKEDAWQLILKGKLFSWEGTVFIICTAFIIWIYSGASFIRTLWFPVKIIWIGEASAYLKCYDLSLKKKIIYVCIV